MIDVDPSVFVVDILGLDLELVVYRLAWPSLGDITDVTARGRPQPHLKSDVLNQHAQTWPRQA